MLRPQPGERLLEIGPGVGYYSLDLAGWIGPGGRLEIFDLQQKFLDHTMARAAKRALTNLTPSRGDAGALPFETASIDAVILTAVLGEIPDKAAALAEMRRVLRPGGRLVIGELFGDPHFVGLKRLRRLAAAAGLSYVRHSGPRLGYFARFSP